MMPEGKTLNHEEGFTLLEIVIAAFIFGVLTTIVITNFLSFKKETSLNNGAREIATALRLSQSKTLSSQDSSQYGVYFDLVGGKYTLYKGASYATRDTLQDLVNNLSNEVEIFEINLGGSNEVVFNKLTGESQQSGNLSLRLKTDTTQTKTIYVSSTGAVSLASEIPPSDSNRVKDSRHVHFDYSRTISTITESITLDFDNGTVLQTFAISPYLVAGQIQWEGTILVGGSNQTVKVVTHRLNNPDTQFSVHRDRSLNNKSLKITISGDSSGNIANYSADGLTTTYSSINVSNFVWQ